MCSLECKSTASLGYLFICVFVPLDYKNSNQQPHKSEDRISTT